MTADVLFSVENQVGLITLNRPQAFNAVNVSMVQAMYQQLLAWQHDEAIHAVVIQAAGDKAFCAGGDVRWIYEHGKKEPDLALSFFELEYRLNQLIADYPKPYIALINGITMGGGVGLSLHGSHPVATERFIFAMPETAIGFFPDIGASYLLARCPDNFGVYLGLTGHRVNAQDAFELGLIKHIITSSDLSHLLQALISADLKSSSKQSVTDCIQKFTKPTLPSSLQQHAQTIRACFQFNSIDEIIQALQAKQDAWCLQTLAVLKQRSPLSLSITLKQLRAAKGLSLDACLATDKILVRHFIQGDDFYEGVRAVLIDKDQTPHWQPADLNAVSDQLVNSYFEA